MIAQRIVSSLVRLGFVYLFYLVLLRLSGKRLIGMGKQSGSRQYQVGTPFDLVVAFIISDLPDDIIFGFVPVAQGVVAVGTVILLHVLTSVLDYRVPAFGRLLDGEPTPILQKGQMMSRHASRERISESELDSMLREGEIEKRDEVEQAQLEPTGVLSIQRREKFKPAEKRDLDEEQASQ